MYGTPVKKFTCDDNEQLRIIAQRIAENEETHESVENEIRLEQRLLEQRLKKEFQNRLQTAVTDIRKEFSERPTEASIVPTKLLLDITESSEGS